MACGEMKHHEKRQKNWNKFHGVWIDEPDQEWNYYLKIQNGVVPHTKYKMWRFVTST